MKKKYVMKFTPITLACSLSLGLISKALAKPNSHLYDVPKIYAVENRRYQTNKDLTIQVGYLPSDAFNKGYLIGGSYTHFFNSYLGWEVLNLNYSFNQATHLKKDLMDCCALEVQNVGFNGALDYIQWYGLSNLVYTPFYTKYLLFNQKVIHGEFSLVGGYGAAHFAHTGTKGMFSGGFYLRFFNESGHSWKFDFRDNVYLQSSLGPTHALSLTIGYSFNLFSNPSSSSKGDG